METELKELIQGNNEANRIKEALEWKRQGKKVMGILCSYVPEEVVHAAGMLPFRITGTWKESLTLANSYRPLNTCGFCNHVLESLLSGELDFLDGVIATDRDQDMVRLWDVWASLDNTPFYYIMHVPFIDSQLAHQQLEQEINKLTKALADFSGNETTEENLHSSIEVFNHMRTLLSDLYELRKKEVPPLSGAEMLGITTTARVIPKEKFNHDLESLFPFLQERETGIKPTRPRFMVSSDMLDNPGYLELIEEVGLVAMDDLDTGIRYFNKNVDSNSADPAAALARRYLTRHGAPRMTFWDKQIDQIIRWVEEFRIDGVINLPQMYCYPQTYRSAFLAKKLKEAGIPNMLFEREYFLSNLGQIKTRVEAFAEMLA